MGQLYEMIVGIDKIIERKELSVFVTRGKIAMRAGFILTSIRPQTPDDPVKIRALRSAAQEVLRERL